MKTQLMLYKRSNLIVLCSLFLSLCCSSGFAVVSDTQSFFVISGENIPADGSSCIVSIWIKDAKGDPLKDYSVNILTSRGTDYDSITQPNLTDINGQCTGSINSVYGGLDTITVTCLGKSIGSPAQWVQTTQEDFASGETQTNIDTTTYPGSIKIFYQFLNFDIPNNDFENGFNNWTKQDPQGNTTWDTITEDKYNGNYSVKAHFKNDTTIVTTENLEIWLLNEDGSGWLAFSSVNPENNWKEGFLSTSSWKGQNVKLKLCIKLVGAWTGGCNAILISDVFKCSGDNISVWTKRYYSGGYLKGYLVDFVQGGKWKEIAPNTATYVSRAYDTDVETPPYGTFTADYTTSGQTISFTLRAADTKDGLGVAEWYVAVNNGPINAPRKRWVQWRCLMQTDNTDTSPLLDSVTINYRAPKSIYFIPVLKITNLSASPNPFSPNNDNRKDTTTISYTLIDKNPRDTVCLRIYNPPQQQVVRTRVNYELQDTGSHQIEWDGRTDTGALVSENGAYICEITAIDSFGNSVVNTMPITVDLIKPVPQVTKMSLGKQQVGLTFEVNELIELYQVWRSDGNTNNFQVISSGVSATDFVDTSPIGDNQNYYYRIIVSDLAGNTETSNIVFARMTQDGGILSNRGNFAVSNMIVKCKDDAQTFVTIPETKTFGDTIDFVKINIIRKNKSLLESEGKIFPVDKKLAGCYEITAKELDSNYNEVGQVVNWQTGKQVNLTLHYDNCPLDKVNALAIYEWSGNQWVKRGGSLNLGNQTLDLNISHFSTYAIMYQTASSFMGAKPNPFTPNNDGINDYVEIRFENSQNQEAKLSIFDLPGHLVWSKTYTAGTNSVTWNGKDWTEQVVEGGAYIYQVEIGTKVVSGIVVVAK